jgi:fructose-bisphosphate aldolase class II
MRNLRHYLHRAYKEKWAIGQFNFSTIEQFNGIVQTAIKLRAPVIVGTSEGESKFVGLQEAVAVRNVFRTKGVPVFLNLDHGKSFEYLKEAIHAGYDMVHFDGSKLPLEDLPAQPGNINISKKVIKAAWWHRVVVEGEVGRIGTDASKVYEGTFEVKEEDLTTVQQAKEYLQKAKVDCLAVSVGTFHGIQASGASPHINLRRLHDITSAVHIPLVLHGGSGTPELDIKEAIKLGICKININTDMRVAFTKALRKSLEADKDEVVPYKYFPEPIHAVQEVVEKYIKLFGSEGRA